MLKNIIPSVFFIFSFLLQANANDIAYINIGTVITKSSLAEQQKSHLDEVKQALDNVISDAQKNYKSMNKEQAAKAKSSDDQLINMQWQIEQRNSMQSILTEIKKASNEVGKEKGYSMIFDEGNMMYADPKNDISTDVISKLKNVKVTFPPIPTFSIKKSK